MRWEPGIPGSRQSWPLVEYVSRSPWFNFSAALVNSQLACLRPVGILNIVVVKCSVLLRLVLKSPYWEWSIEYICVHEGKSCAIVFFCLRYKETCPLCPATRKAVNLLIHSSCERCIPLTKISRKLLRCLSLKMWRRKENIMVIRYGIIPPTLNSVPPKLKNSSQTTSNKSNTSKVLIRCQTFSLNSILFARPWHPGLPRWHSVSTTKVANTKTATRMTRAVLFIFSLCNVSSVSVMWQKFVGCCLRLKGLPVFLNGQTHHSK